MPTCSLSRTQPADHREAAPFSTIVDASLCHGADVQFTSRPCRSSSSKQQSHALVRHDRRPQWSRSRERADSQLAFCNKREHSNNRLTCIRRRGQTVFWATALRVQEFDKGRGPVGLPGRSGRLVSCPVWPDEGPREGSLVKFRGGRSARCRCLPVGVCRGLEVAGSGVGESGPGPWIAARFCEQAAGRTARGGRRRSLGCDRRERNHAGRRQGQGAPGGAGYGSAVRGGGLSVRGDVEP